ncbi:nucleoside-binding protein [Arboricoccus pini]|uniref:Nucleoside-binding protein n=1 Tax=Arboricoccus pini TaxID=1963835 RepID=A0A212QBN4_9PROT|nr:BMP family ABC transporter substrate-binding protein [Arboricoccus pini]SNB56806.1 nucleoside-binding protein [Arboricoccus pini]
MSWTMDRRRALGASVATVAGLALPGRARAEGPLKAGWVYVGPVGDYGYSYQHDQGRLAAQSHFGDKIQTSFVENVSEGPDAERVIRQLATTGNDIVFATSFGFMNGVEKVARSLPAKKFEHATGYKRLANLATYDARFYEGRAVIGTIAGHLTKTKKIGYIGSFPIPEVVQGINSFTLAMQKVNPEATVSVIWVNSWYDPGKEADAAKAHFDQGADIIVQHTDSPAALQVAEQRGLMGFGQSSDMRKFAPNCQLSAIVDNWSAYYIRRLGQVMDGSWTSGAVWMGLDTGNVEIAPYGPKVTPEAASAADQIKGAIIAKKLHPFTGPIVDQKGTQHAAAGETLSDEALSKMDWYVPGVHA